mgnify:FL=1|jgi:hypothetical protein
MKNIDNTTRIVFDIEFKKNKKDTLKTWNDWRQIENICTLLNERSSLEIGRNATNHNQLVMVFDNTWSHILERASKIMRNLESLVEHLGGTFEVVREQEEE